MYALVAACGALVGEHAALVSRSAVRMPAPPMMAALPTPDRRAALQAAALAGAAFAAPGAGIAASGIPSWQPVDLPIATESPILFDIEFDPANPKNGFIVGNKGTFLQTTDGGKTWNAKSFANLDPEEEINYRFTKMSFLDGEVHFAAAPRLAR
jgi:photosystem II stability/assembly factor-like uncharacterized protein